MHMVWHDAPGNETVPFPIKVFQSVLNKFCDPLVAQVASTFSAIRVFLDLFPQGHGFFRVRSKPFAPMQFLFPLLDDLGGDGVVEPEGDELDGVFRIKVREVAAGVPASGCGRGVRTPGYVPDKP